MFYLLYIAKFPFQWHIYPERLLTVLPTAYWNISLPRRGPPPLRFWSRRLWLFSPISNIAGGSQSRWTEQVCWLGNRKPQMSWASINNSLRFTCGQETGPQRLPWEPLGLRLAGHHSLFQPVIEPTIFSYGYPTYTVRSRLVHNSIQNCGRVSAVLKLFQMSEGLLSENLHDHGGFPSRLFSLCCTFLGFNRYVCVSLAVIP